MADTRDLKSLDPQDRAGSSPASGMFIFLNLSMTTIKLTPELIISAYCNGYFPMGLDNTSEIGWFRPDPRAIIDLDDFHISNSLKRFQKKLFYEVKINYDFRTVMKYCMNRKEGTWITTEMLDLYYEIHKLGFAHSLEIYVDGQLGGGLYGISIHGAFFGESMFYLKSNCSKIALMELVSRMKKKGMILLDTQFTNKHMDQFNIKHIKDKDYILLLEKALGLPVSFI
ncbi:MAG: hypothetical protein ACD_79C00422G0010 [uncultured bacterium]|nr:MAG: hypothetical protein ACD_79C00422G0010 [uncultured bacterium]